MARPEEAKRLPIDRIVGRWVDFQGRTGPPEASKVTAKMRYGERDECSNGEGAHHERGR